MSFEGLGLMVPHKTLLFSELSVFSLWTRTHTHTHSSRTLPLSYTYTCTHKHTHTLVHRTSLTRAHTLICTLHTYTVYDTHTRACRTCLTSLRKNASMHRPFAYTCPPESLVNVKTHPLFSHLRALLASTPAVVCQPFCKK